MAVSYIHCEDTRVFAHVRVCNQPGSGIRAAHRLCFTQRHLRNHLNLLARTTIDRETLRTSPFSGCGGGVQKHVLHKTPPCDYLQYGYDITSRVLRDRQICQQIHLSYYTVTAAIDATTHTAKITYFESSYPAVQHRTRFGRLNLQRARLPVIRLLPATAFARQCSFRTSFRSPGFECDHTPPPI